MIIFLFCFPLQGICPDIVSFSINFFILFTVISVEPAGKAFFVEGCMQTSKRSSLKCPFNKELLDAVYESVQRKMTR